MYPHRYYQTQPFLPYEIAFNPNVTIIAKILG